MSLSLFFPYSLGIFLSKRIWISFFVLSLCFSCSLYSAHAAPEVIKDQQYSYAADIWSVGATCLEMATGIPPWFSLENPNEHHLAALFRIGSSTVPPTIPEGLPDDLKHFISSCLRIPPNERPSCSELLHHSFLHRRSTALRGDSLSSLQSKASSVGPKTHFKTSFGSPDEGFLCLYFCVTAQPLILLYWILNDFLCLHMHVVEFPSIFSLSLSLFLLSYLFSVTIFFFLQRFHHLASKLQFVC